MKKRLRLLTAFALLLGLTLITVLATADVALNGTNFPDEKFLGCVRTYDNDSDGILSDEEISKVDSLDLNEPDDWGGYIGYGITDLTGIEYFTALETLNCSGNHIVSLDLSHNTA